MSELTKEQMLAMLRTAVDRIEANHEELSRLDAATGDGDHGITMNRSMQSVKQTMEVEAEKPLADILQAVGWNIMCQDGGSTGPLLGSYFMGMSEAVAGDTLDGAAVGRMFQAGFDNLCKQTKAQPGDKTMVDALAPATQAMVDQAPAGIGAALTAAAEAAVAGAEATKQMVAKFGRARNMGERVIGHTDPGAVSISHIFAGFAAGYAK